MHSERPASRLAPDIVQRGMIASLLGSATVTLGPVTLDHYSLLLALSSLGRALMALVFARRL
jgi:hypothetical protein